ncbi:MAG TPA: sensor histidine kinase [Bryobacteraceae bacterium]|nr:sensor histidine kinase [Bryobacteraceae bacterium]
MHVFARANGGTADLTDSEQGERERNSERTFTTARKPFGAAIQALTRRERKLLAEWRRQLQGRVGSRQAFGPDPESALWNAALKVTKTGFPEFSSILSQVGDDLARREVAPEEIVSVIAGLENAALACLTREQQAEAAALFRMASLASVILFAGYARHWRTRADSVESRLRDAEERMLGASSYVTGVYERERRRLSHDLHDEIGHELVVLKLRLELIAADAGQNKLALLSPRLNDALELVGRAIDSVRRLVMDLGPAVFDDLGFLPAIRLYGRQFSASTGIDVTIREGDMPAEIPLSHQTALYRVMQGALSNTLRHAKAKHVTVAFACLKNSQLMMTIEDDGVGFDTTAVRAKQRFGLTAMRERIAVLGGKVHVQSWPASPLGGRRGTRIEVDLPLAGGGSR